MAEIQHVRDRSAAHALADLLNGSHRTRPVVVVTIPAGRPRSWIDVDEIAAEAGKLADVFLMETGQFTWEFSNRMPDGTQVYGGAGRVYPVGHEWASDRYKSPLRFAYDAGSGVHATDQLISDLLRMAAAAGLVEAARTNAHRQVRGTVTSTVAGRAFVDVGSRLPGSIAEELTVEDVRIDRIVRPGQTVEGLYDPVTHRVDVTRSLRPSTQALQAYSVGDVVLTKATQVAETQVELMLFPRTATPAVTVAVAREDVTGNPFDDLRTLVTVGEVIAARVTSAGPEWALRLSDVDDDEPIVAAPSLLADGPPWLVEEEIGAPAEPAAELAPPTAPPVSDAPGEPDSAEHEPPATTQDAPGPVVRPTPALLDPHRRRSAPPARPAPEDPGQASGSTRGLLLQIDTLKAEAAGLAREKAGLQAQLRDAAHERDQLGYLLKQAQREAAAKGEELKSARARLRKAGRVKQAEATDEARFADPEQGFRHVVLTRWATRIEPGEQADLPLADYVIGPKFLESLERLEGIKREKVADVVVDILTDRAHLLASREVHQLRTGPGGDDPVRTRGDGAVAWRVSLQVRSPSARRIHYWKLPSGQVELARVGTHDDFEI